MHRIFILYGYWKIFYTFELLIIKTNNMKKALLSLVLVFTLGLFLTSSYAVTNVPLTNQTELFVQSCNAP